MKASSARDLRNKGLTAVFGGMRLNLTLCGKIDGSILWDPWGLNFLPFEVVRQKRCLSTPLVHYCHCPLEMRPFIHAESYNSNRITPRKQKYYWKSAPWGIFYTALSSLMLSGLLSVKLLSLPLEGCSSLLLNTARKPCPTFKSFLVL